jgi:hypothetical protein
MYLFSWVHPICLILSINSGILYESKNHVAHAHVSLPLLFAHSTFCCCCWRVGRLNARSPVECNKCSFPAATRLSIHSLNFGLMRRYYNIPLISASGPQPIHFSMQMSWCACTPFAIKALALYKQKQKQQPSVRPTNICLLDARSL